MFTPTKAKNALTILRDLDLDVCFTEILTSQSGFARKPSPEAATYLISKYHLKPDRTYYIGDRTLDIEFAQNSGIQSTQFPWNSGGLQSSDFLFSGYSFSLF